MNGRRPGKSTSFISSLGNATMHKNTDGQYVPQLIVGPRQTGKTTLALQYLRDLVTGGGVYVGLGEIDREIVVFCRGQSTIDNNKKRVGEDIASKVRWETYKGYGIPELLDLSDHDTFCFFLDLVPIDDLVMNILSEGPEPGYQNPCVIELAIEAPHVKYVL